MCKLVKYFINMQGLQNKPLAGSATLVLAFNTCSKKEHFSLVWKMPPAQIQQDFNVHAVPFHTDSVLTDSPWWTCRFSLNGVASSSQSHHTETFTLKVTPEISRKKPVHLVHVFGLWEAAKENPGRHGKNMQISHGKAPGPQWGQTQSANHCASYLGFVLLFCHSNQGKKQM